MAVRLRIHLPTTMTGRPEATVELFAQRLELADAYALRAFLAGHFPSGRDHAADVAEAQLDRSSALEFEQRNDPGAC